MQFVIFSYSFLPRSGPECFCTTRFASALAEAGHDVHVVTMDWPMAVSQETYDFLVDKRLRITRVAVSAKRRNNLARLRYLTTEWESRDYGRIIAALKSVLRSYDKPVLISRSCPETSHIVAWHCRRYAWRWIVHFSDPIPFGAGGGSLRNILWNKLSHRWVGKVLKSCDGVSLTCEEAKRFYHETYGVVFDNKPCHITEHIGAPALPVREKWSRPKEPRIIVHAGMLYGNRGERQILEALDEINANGLVLKFIQIGECGNNARLFAGRKDVEVIESTSPDLAMSIVDAADISYIPDVQCHLPYTPFMPSKFVYQLFTDKPLVLFTRPGSPMYNRCQRSSNAGLFCADYTRPGMLTDAIKRAIGCFASTSDREALRKDFTPQTISSRFVEFVRRRMS